MVSEFLDSSLTVKAVSQPQKPKIEPDSPTMKADSVSPAGENQDRLKSSPPPAVSCLRDGHDREDHQHDHLEDTSTICTFSVVSMPR